MQTHLKWDIEIERIETAVMTAYYTQRYKKVVRLSLLVFRNRIMLGIGPLNIRVQRFE